MRKKVTVWGEVKKGFGQIGGEIKRQVLWGDKHPSGKKKVRNRGSKKSKYVYF
jgi:hypothetical protein